MSAALFSPIALRGLTLPNRIVISPMCQYSAADGCATDWHTIHLGHLAFSGAGLLILEATGVAPDARISRECLGLYSDDCETALGRVLGVVRRYANMPIGIQLAHAGRKGSQKKPTDGRGSIPAGAGDWQTVAPSALPFIPEWQTPVALDRAGMLGVTASFVAATRRAARLGLDLIELHFAHGYLMSSFLSPLANRRTGATTSMAAASTIACAIRWKYSPQCAPPGPTSVRWACAATAPTGTSPASRQTRRLSFRADSRRWVATMSMLLRAAIA